MIVLMLRMRRCEPSRGVKARRRTTLSTSETTCILARCRQYRCPGAHPTAPTKRVSLAQTRSRTPWASHVRSIRTRKVSSRVTPSSKDSSSGWTRLKVRSTWRFTMSSRNYWRMCISTPGKRKVIWPDAERLDIEQSVQRIQKLYRNFPRDEIEEFMIDWIDMGYEPENYSPQQFNELDRLTERWVADHLRKAKTSKKRTRTRHS